MTAQTPPVIKPNALAYMAKHKKLCLWQMAFAHAYLHWQQTGKLPVPATVPAAVARLYGGRRMSQRTAHYGIQEFEKTLKKKDATA